jgi:prepilin-type N-terminal cleavage/methylation domain-containing protein
MNNLTKTEKGFTLIELLMVVSIVSLLSAILIANVSSARAKARNAARILEVKQFINALEIYRTTNGTYPDTNPVGVNVWVGECVGTPCSIIASGPGAAGGYGPVANDTVLEHPSSGLGVALSSYIKLNTISVGPAVTTNASAGIFYYHGYDSNYGKTMAEVAWSDEKSKSQCPGTTFIVNSPYDLMAALGSGALDSTGGTICELDMPE